MFNVLIRLFICVNLVFSPTWSFAQQAAPEDIRQEQLDIVNNYNQQVDSLFAHTFGPRASSDFYANHSLDFYSLVEQQVHKRSGRVKQNSKETPPETPFFNFIRPEHLIVEIIEDSNLKEKANVETVLSAHTHSIKDILPEEIKEKYNGRTYITDNNQSLRTFRISYQQQTLHTFSNNIQWMTFFGSYLVFMEGAQIYEKTAHLSFIDLAYFHSAIGKTALPVFRIPISIDSPEKADMLFNPSEISVNTDGLIVRGRGTEHIISNIQMEEIARTQHSIFNVLVSLLSIDRYSRDMLPFFKDIARHTVQLLQQTQHLGTTEQGRQLHGSQQIVEQVTSELLKARVDLGVPSHHAGHYGQVKAAQSRLGEFQLGELDQEALNKSIEHLEKDKKFQAALEGLYKQKFGKRRIVERIKGLWAQLSRPQPLGAAKIQSALGLIANAVRPGGTIENRFTALKEGIYQLSAHKKRIIAVPVLAGMAGFAAPEVAQFYSTTISYVGQTLGEGFNILKQVKELKSIVDVPQAYNSYIASGKVVPLSIGVASVFGAMLLLVYSIHIPVNTMRFVKYLKTQRAYEHQHSAGIHRKKLAEHFKDFARETKSTYFKNLAHGEFKKVGMPATFTLPDNSIVEMAFQTMEQLSSVVEDYRDQEFTVHLRVNINKGEQKLHFISSPDESERQGRFNLMLSTTDATATRPFRLESGMITDMVENNLLKDNPSIEIHIENREGKIISLYQGNFINRAFTPEEQAVLQEVLTETKYQRIYDAIINDVVRQKVLRTASQEPSGLTEINLSETEIKSIGQAIKIFLFDFSSFANTEYIKANIWNYWFLIRTFVTDPRALVTFSLFPHYFNRVYTHAHISTAFNNGDQFRFVDTVRRLYPSGREYLSALKQFEAEIIPIERQHLRAVAEYTYLLALKRVVNKEGQLDGLIASGVQKQVGAVELLPKENLIDRENFSLDLKNLSKQDSSFLDFFQTILFEESMRDYLKEALGITEDASITDEEVLSKLRERLKQGNPIILREESLDAIRDRVRRVADQNNTEEKVQKTMGRFYRAFIKKRTVKNKAKLEKKLNPNKSLQMERFYTAQILSKDPEAMARATRSELSKLITDKPIELFLLFALMSGMEYGILKVLYSDSFSANSFFYLSSYLIWTVFISTFVMDLMAGSWMKLQIDSQQAFGKGFDVLPKKEDVEKKLAAIKWFLKSWTRAGNEFGEKYKFMWRIVISNLRAAIVTLTVIHLATVGRVDIELIIGAFLVQAAFGQEALRYKMEGTYENFNGFALKDLIKKNININKFLTHPVVQRILIDESFKYRLKFNVLNSFFVMNIVENFFRLVESSEALSGSRAVYRTFMPSNSLFTEYWSRVTIYAQSLPLPAGVVNLCRKAFTRNRFDLSD